MVMMCVEWWTYEIGSFLAGKVMVSKHFVFIKTDTNSRLPFVSMTGLISDVELGAQSVVYELACVAFMVSSAVQNYNCSSINKIHKIFYIYYLSETDDLLTCFSKKTSFG